MATPGSWPVRRCKCGVSASAVSSSRMGVPAVPEDPRAGSCWPVSAVRRGIRPGSACYRASEPRVAQLVGLAGALVAAHAASIAAGRKVVPNG